MSKLQFVARLGNTEYREAVNSAAGWAADRLTIELTSPAELSDCAMIRLFGILKGMNVRLTIESHEDYPNEQ